MIIRNKKTGKTYEVMRGTRYPSFFEEVKETPKLSKTTEVAKGSVSKATEHEESAKTGKRTSKKFTQKGEEDEKTK